MNQQQQAQNNGPTQIGNNSVINNPMLGSQNNPMMVSNQFNFPQTNIALQVDPVTQEKIKQIRLNEAKFDCWYQFMNTEQVGKIQTHMDKTYSEYGKRISELTTNKENLTIILKEFTTLRDKCQTRIEDQDNELQRKREQYQDYESRVEALQKYVDELEEKISTIRASVKVIAQEYKVSNELVKYEKLENKLLIEMFTCLNYVLYDGSKFDWVAFQKKTFYCKMEKTDSMSKYMDNKNIAQEEKVKDDKDKDQDKDKVKVKVEVVQADNIQYQLETIIFGSLPEGKIRMMQSLLEYEGLKTDNSVHYNVDRIGIDNQLCQLRSQMDVIKKEIRNTMNIIELKLRQYNAEEENLMQDQCREQLQYNQKMADDTQELITNLINLQSTISKAQDKVYLSSQKMSSYLPNLKQDLAVTQSPSKIK